MIEMPEKIQQHWNRIGGYGEGDAWYRDRLYHIAPVSPFSYFVQGKDVITGQCKSLAISSLYVKAEDKKMKEAKIVVFQIKSGIRDGDANRKAINKAMGISDSEWRNLYNNGGEIRCRPDQFGLFICYREEFGIDCNRIKELSPVVKVVQNYDTTIDVTDR